MDKEEILRNLKEQYKKPTKRYEQKINRFYKVADIAEKIANKITKNKLEKDDLQRTLIYDYYYHSHSVLSAFSSAKGSIEEKYQSSVVKSTGLRLKNFMKIHGDEKLSDKGKKTMQDYLNQYLRTGNKKDKKILYDKIKMLKAKNPEKFKGSYGDGKTAQNVIEQNGYGDK